MNKQVVSMLITLILLGYLAYAGETPQNGIVKKYYPSGKVELEQIYKNGKLDGKVKGYYEDGHFKSEVNFQNGKVNGPYKNYYEDGTLQSDGQYKDNKMVGVQSTYYPNGKLKTEETYENGILTMKNNCQEITVCQKAAIP